MEISIVIVTHNVRDLLRACLQAVFASDFPYPFEVFVVDNGGDDSLAMVAKEFPQATCVVGSPYMGYAAGNNVALRQAQGRYLLLLNPDTVVPPTALRQLHELMEAHPHWGIIGPKLVLPDGSLDLACRRVFPTPWNALMKATGLATRFPHWRLTGEYNLTYLDPDEPYPVDSVVGACMFIRQAALQQVGLLDETFFMYGEDLDLCYRMKQAGWQVWYRPEVVIEHHKGESSRQRPRRVLFEFYRAMHIFYRKHYAPGSHPLLSTTVIAGIWLLCGLALLRHQLRGGKQERPRFALA